MDKTSYARIAALSVSVVIVVGSVLPLPLEELGLTRTSPFWTRLLYPLLHATALHALVNAWCLLVIFFRYPVTLGDLLWSILVSVLLPSACLTHQPTVGLSVAIYFLFGRITWMTQRRLQFVVWLLFYLAIGYLLPAINAWAHLWGCALGLVYGLLNTPVSWIRR